MTHHDSGNADRRAAMGKGRRLILLVSLLVVASLAFVAWRQAGRMWLDASLQNLRVAVGSRHYREGVTLAREIIDFDPDHMEAAMLGADAATGANDPDACLEFLRVATRHKHPHLAEAFVRLGMLHLQRWEAHDAEQAFRRAIEVDPRNPAALQQLAFLLSLEGRRAESLPYRFRLLTLGHFTIDDLALLGHHQVVLNARQQLEQFLRADPHDPMPHIGLGRLALQVSRVAEAEEHFRAVIAAVPQSSDAWAWWGHALLRRPRNELDAAMRRWYSKLPESAREHVETWIVLGRWAQQRRDWAGAARCFWEAARRDPDHGIALYQLGVSMAAAGEGDRGTPIRRRAEAVQELEQICSALHESSITARRMARAAELCEMLGRVWESAAWCRVLLQYRRPPGVHPDRAPKPDELDAFAEARQICRMILSRVEPHIRRRPERIVARLNPLRTLDLAGLPLPAFDQPLEIPLQQPLAELDRQPAFVDVTRRMGIDFTYFNADDPSTEGRRMFEFTGGGAAVIDFDQDGWPDIYLTQGCPWPPGQETAAYRDRLYRNLGGRRFVDVTDAAGLGDDRFSQGAAAGDYNNDGWPDLLVGNVGRNRLYLNNGDGTFRETTAEAGLRGDLWTTSVAVADLNGDSIPDLYCVNYLKKGRAMELICGRDGKLRACSPTEFDAEQDRLLLGRGDGTFLDRTAACGVVRPHGKGLGCLVAHLSRSETLDLFVANDTTANFLLVNRRPAGTTPLFEDRALLAGLAHSRNGEAQACMGIALDDADGDGRDDLLVTNFYGDWNTFYHRQPADTLLFLDESDAWGVTETSLQTLGFGCQFLDGELDGLPDLIITNGHVDDFSFRGDPYRMRPQYLRNVGGRFTDWPAEQLGPFFQRERLGRGLARIDFDGDGLEEFVVSYLETPVALVHNRCRRPGHFLAVRLSSRHGARDAIGTRVTIEAGGWKRSRQLTAGDGYMASNERILIFGLGARHQIDRLTVRWPDGTVEHYDQVMADQHLRLVQGMGVFPLHTRTARP